VRGDRHSEAVFGRGQREIPFQSEEAIQELLQYTTLGDFTVLRIDRI
jgi:hypothetical protein